MSQYPSTSNPTNTISSSMVLIQSGACQLTGFTIYNPNSTNVWLHFKDSSDVSSAATGSTSCYKLLIPAENQIVAYVNSGTSDDPDGIWSFASGITVKAVTGFADSNNTAPSTPISVWFQIRP